MTLLGEVLAAATIVIAVPLVWTVWWLVRSLAKRRRSRTGNGGNEVLKWQVRVVRGLALIVTVFGVVFINNDLAIPLLNLDQTRVLTRSTVFVVAVDVAVAWLRLYRPWDDRTEP